MPVFCWQGGTIDRGTSLIFGAGPLKMFLALSGWTRVKFLAVGVKQLRDIICGSIVDWTDDRMWCFKWRWLKIGNRNVLRSMESSLSDHKIVRFWCLEIPWIKRLSIVNRCSIDRLSDNWNFFSKVKIASLETETLLRYISTKMRFQMWSACASDLRMQHSTIAYVKIQEHASLSLCSEHSSISNNKNVPVIKKSS